MPARGAKRANEDDSALIVSKADNNILACISNAYINKVLILSDRSFVSPPSPSESKTSPEDMSKHTLRNLREENAGITTQNCAKSRQ